MLDALVASRLVIADQDTVEVAHEAVCRAWPRLRAWLNEVRDGLRLHRHLAQASREWGRSGGDASELYRGGAGRRPRLGQAGTTPTSTNQGRTLPRRQRRPTRRRRTTGAPTGSVAFGQDYRCRGSCSSSRCSPGVFAVRSGREARWPAHTARAAQQEAQVQRDGAQAAQQVAQEEHDNARGGAAESARPTRVGRARCTRSAGHSHCVRRTGRWRRCLRSKPFVAGPTPRRGRHSSRHSPQPPTFQGTSTCPPNASSPAPWFQAPRTRSSLLTASTSLLVDLVTGEINSGSPQAPDGCWPTGDCASAATGRSSHSLIEVPRRGRQHARRVQHGDRPESCSDRSHRRSSPPTSPSTPTARWWPSLAGPTETSPSTELADGQPVGSLLGVQARPQGINLKPDTAALEFGGRRPPLPGARSLGPIRVVDVSAMQVVAHLRHAAAVVEQPDHRHVVRIARGGRRRSRCRRRHHHLLRSVGRWPASPESNACSSIAVAEGYRIFSCRNTLSTRTRDTASAASDDSRSGISRPGYQPASASTHNRAPPATSASRPTNASWSRSATTLRLISRWRLDGSGRGGHPCRATARTDQRWIRPDRHHDAPRRPTPAPPSGYRRQERARRIAADDRYVWDPNVDQMIDPLDGIAMARWAGTPGRLLAVFEDRTIGMLRRGHTGPASRASTIEPLDSRLTTFGRSVDNSPLLPRIPRRAHPNVRQHQRQADRADHPNAGGVFGSITRQRTTAPGSSPRHSATSGSGP